VPPKQILDNQKSIISILSERLPDTQLYVQSILPVNENIIEDHRKNSSVVVLNDGIRTICSTKGIQFLNLYPYFIDANSQLDTAYTKDGLHLNGKAYQKWHTIIKPFVEE
jgi:lysophospholipase L1-like esterase